MLQLEVQAHFRLVVGSIPTRIGAQKELFTQEQAVPCGRACPRRGHRNPSVVNSFCEPIMVGIDPTTMMRLHFQGEHSLASSEPQAIILVFRHHQQHHASSINIQPSPPISLRSHLCTSLLNRRDERH